MWQIDPFDPDDIMTCKYTNLVTGHYRMRCQYRIVRPAGTHDWLIKLTLSGCGLVRHAEGDIKLRPGQIVAFKPENPHDYGTDPQAGRWEMLWVHFHPLAHWLPLLDWNEVARGVLLLDLPRKRVDSRRAIEFFHETHRLATSSLPRRDWLAMNAMEGMLLRCDALATRCRVPLDPRLEELTEYINRNLSDRLTLEEISRISHLSISQFSNLFRNQLHISPQQYIETRRMELAKRLLQFPNFSVKEVSARSGYNDPLYFSKRFHRHTGRSPVDYRKHCLNEADGQA